MDDFLTNAYIISTVVIVFLIILLCPYSTYIFKKYIGHPFYIALSIGFIIWCVCFITIGVILKPKIKKNK